MRAAHVLAATEDATLLVMPDLAHPGWWILRIQGHEGDGAIVLGTEGAEEVAGVLSPVDPIEGDPIADARAARLEAERQLREQVAYTEGVRRILEGAWGPGEMSGGHPAHILARTLVEKVQPVVDGAWLELRLRAAFRAGCNRAMVPSSDTVIPTEDQFVAAELAKVAPL